MPRQRSKRSNFKSLVELEKRANESAPLFGEEAFNDSDDQSFDADHLSDDGEVGYSLFIPVTVCDVFTN